MRGVPRVLSLWPAPLTLTLSPLGQKEVAIAGVELNLALMRATPACLLRSPRATLRAVMLSSGGTGGESRRGQKTKAGAKLKPGNTGTLASNNSLPLHFPFTS